MNHFISKKNREVLQIINKIDAVPNASRQVTFWFYSASEKSIYRFAHHLQELNMKIKYCGKTDSDNQEYLLIAEKCMHPTTKKMNNLCKYFTESTNRFDVKYDGWETRIELD